MTYLSLLALVRYIFLDENAFNLLSYICIYFLIYYCLALNNMNTI